MALLPPTVGERLARCGTSVAVWGIVPGASVELRVDGTTVQTQTVNDSWIVFTLASELAANQSVSARQTLAPDPTSNDSPAVVVGDVQIPPPPPRLTPDIFSCANCVYVDGLAPGATVTLLTGGVDGTRTLGSAVADGDGTACFSPSDLSADQVFGTATVCASTSVFSPPSNVIAAPASLPAPNLSAPIFGCQTFVDMDGLTQGATVEVFDSGVSLGTFCSCWGAVHCNVGTALATGHAITAKQSMMARAGCTTDGAMSSAVTVIAPDARIKPVLEPVLYDGDQLVRVDNQIGGGVITLYARANASAPENELGRAGASQFDIIALNAPLTVGQIVRAKQSLCGHDEFSDPQTVQPRPVSIAAPVVRAPLYDCGTLVPVDGVLPGAQVRVFQSGFPVGFALAGGSTVTVHVGPALQNGNDITASQRVGGVDGPLSAAVTVGSLASLPAPQVLAPVRIGDRSANVAGAVPGAYVEVLDGTQLVGTASAEGGVVTVPLAQAITAASQLHARQTLCAQTSPTSTGDPSPIGDPSQQGPFTPSAPGDVPTFTLNVPATPDGPSATLTLGGELTYPQAPGNPGAVDPGGAPYPLVVIAHGMHDSSVPSYQGYRYLTSQLASLGMICFSIDLNSVNAIESGTNIDHRGDAILAAVSMLLQRNGAAGDLLQNMIDPARIGLIGHSRGAEGVVDAQVKNVQRGTPFQIRCVVPIAPTNFLSLDFTGSSLFIVYGAFDNDVSGASVVVNPFFIYDHAQCPKAMIFIHRARHNGFNTVWVATDNETVLPGTLSPDEHQAILKGYVSAYFQDLLLASPGYEVYVSGPSRPPGLETYSIHHQYQLVNRLVVDNFGDADAQLGLAAETPLRRDLNRLAQPVAYSDTSTSAWANQSSQALSQNPHDSDMTELVWSVPQIYSSEVDSRDVRAFTFLSLRLGQQYQSGAVLNPANQPQDLLVTLLTSGGAATVRIGTITDVPFPDQRPGQDWITKAALKTVRVPLAAFAGINPALRLGAVTGVRLNFGVTPLGAISGDDVEFTV
ncbi:hypothetical protein [Paraburkholderia sp. BL10I2N1]|uniref:hypothetical protein n=1 Tax=Paraburkholderia sp. BL10I2N1 TaxID=1938796 RepID=UPI00105B4129|nr:hypothetical protein [Paraburkholderia sp. BL10I2N1]TDN67061.1 hypothetical protein B0G77_0282 [Paraburkholderia sp. BL10I2N1]